MVRSLSLCAKVFISFIMFWFTWNFGVGMNDRPCSKTDISA